MNDFPRAAGSPLGTTISINWLAPWLPLRLVKTQPSPLAFCCAAPPPLSRGPFPTSYDVPTARPPAARCFVVLLAALRPRTCTRPGSLLTAALLPHARKPEALDFVLVAVSTGTISTHRAPEPPQLANSHHDASLDAHVVHSSFRAPPSCQFQIPPSGRRVPSGLGKGTFVLSLLQRPPTRESTAAAFPALVEFLPGTVFAFVPTRTAKRSH